MNECRGTASWYSTWTSTWESNRTILQGLRSGSASGSSNTFDPLAAYLIDASTDPELECVRYSELLKDNPLDLCCLGIGENGHLAFNDPPGADLSDPLDLRVVTLEESCRIQQVNEGHFPGLSSVPEQAITVTVPALLRARKVVAVVPEARKAQPVFAALNGPVSSACPASALRTKLDASLHLDQASASLLTR